LRTEQDRCEEFEQKKNGTLSNNRHLRKRVLSSLTPLSRQQSLHEVTKPTLANFGKIWENRVGFLLGNFSVTLRNRAIT
jgi:hypothetical protein